MCWNEEVCHGLKEALKAISVSPIGVYVIASTLGSLESLLVYLDSVEIPVNIYHCSCFCTYY
ncbi:unnamed protein product [Protopolystoma xenopodis]|uniref:Uncharacterized protein n=1 Tax=Protopolystoma xenopodis TaxID=117903 RepID=A0A3S5C011_9PLAT|nr:unnamed protein product [Protopolystoma xenopodis]